MSRQKTHDEFVADLEKINENIHVVGKYVRAAEKIQVACNICGYTWSATPNNLLRGKGCPACSKTKKLTHEDFVNRLINNGVNVTLLDNFKRRRDRIRVMCNVCGHIWEPSGDSLLLHNSEEMAGHGCPICAAKIRGVNQMNTRDEIIRRINNIHNNIEMVGEYRGIHTNTEFLCLTCGTKWEAMPGNVIRSQICCPNCVIKYIKDLNTVSNEEFVKKLHERNPRVIPLDEYTAAKDKMRFKCKKCNNIWSATANSALNGHSCPRCTMSFGEIFISSILNENHVKYETQHKFADCRNINQLPFDFYLNNFNACIEYDGIQHFESVEVFGGDDALIYTKLHDQIKTDYCSTHGIKLLRVNCFMDEDEIKNNILSFINDLVMDEAKGGGVLYDGLYKAV